MTYVKLKYMNTKHDIDNQCIQKNMKKSTSGRTGEREK